MKKLVLIGFVLFLIGFFITSKNSTYILGGEGNYFLKPISVLNTYTSTWHENLNGVGSRNPIMNFSAFLIILSIAEKFIGMQVWTKIFLPLFYVICFILAYKVSMTISRSKKTAILVSTFYVLNPFFVTHSSSMMYWNIFPLILFPLTYLILSSYWTKLNRSLFYFGLVSTILSFSLANIPYLGVFMIFLPICFCIIATFEKSKYSVRLIFIKYIQHLVVFVLLSLWWLIPLVSAQFLNTIPIYQKSVALSWSQTSSEGKDILQRVLTLRSISVPHDGDYLTNFYNNPIVILISYIPLFIIISFLVREKVNIAFTISFLFILIGILLNKGLNAPFSELYHWALDKIPFFIIFKTPLEKFSVLVSFLLACLLSIVISKKSSKFNRALLILYILVLSIPVISGKIVSDFNIDGGSVTRRIVMKQEYVNAINILSGGDWYRYLSLPGSVNYQVTIENNAGTYYRGMDPILYAINKPFIAAYSGEMFLPIYKNIGNENIGKLLGIYSIKKVLINSDIYPSFGFVEKEDLATISENLNKSMTFQNVGSITIYDNPYYFPHIFVPKLITNMLDATPSAIAKYILSDKYREGEVVVDSVQEFPELMTSVSYSTHITFKKMSPDKYMVNLFKINQKTPIVFNEKYDTAWKLRSSVELFDAKDLHFIANGYANGWIIDPDTICSESPKSCTKNPDGSYDISLIIEFWPQRLFYLGLIISGTTLFGLTGYSAYIWSKERKVNRYKNENDETK